MPEGKPMTAEETAEMKRTCTPNLQLSYRQVRGGYILNGTIAWSRDGDLVGVQRDEAVASDLDDVLFLIKVYHDKAGF